MENLPVEVIGNILSHVGSARDVVVASLTCKKWREALRNHLNHLSFNASDWPYYRDLSCSSLEELITSAIFQTKGLQGLNISMDIQHEFSAASAIAWLMYTRDSLCQLCYNVKTNPNFNIINVCDRRKLQVLALGCVSISGVNPSYHKFPCLKSLSLSSVCISAFDLSHLLSACPILETLSIVRHNITVLGLPAIVEFRSPSLKDIFFESFGTTKLTIEADLLENLHLKNSTIETFQLIGMGTLKVLKIDHVCIPHFYIGDDAKNLEILDVCNFIIRWPQLYYMISKASKLYRLRLWGVVFYYEKKVINIEANSVTFPRLTHLSLNHEFINVVLDYSSQGLPFLMNVEVLELGWTTINDLFSDWVAELLKTCPNLKKLVIHGLVSQINTHEEWQTLARFSNFMLQQGREYTDIEFEFEYK